jgi:hypothetical protein
LDPDTEIVELLARWFDLGDELALKRARHHLAKKLLVSRETRDVLGGAFVEDLRNDVLTGLLDRESGKLRDSPKPLAYARQSLRNAIVSHLRKWGRREDRSPEVERHIVAQAPVTGHERVEAAIDAARALEIVNGLSQKRRMAVLLTAGPNRITDTDWAALVAPHPPPPPTRPTEALEREEAASLLYPPDSNETPSQRDQRLNNFDHTYSRAIKDIRAKLEITS